MYSRLRPVLWWSERWWRRVRTRSRNRWTYPTAFLNGTIDNGAYLRIPDGFEVEGEPRDGEDTERWVGGLLKGGNGTKQGLRLWVLEFHFSADRLRLFSRGDVKIFLPIEPNGGEQTQHNNCHPPISWPTLQTFQAHRSRSSGTVHSSGGLPRFFCDGGMAIGEDRARV